jgi:hypothetical protein
VQHRRRLIVAAAGVALAVVVVAVVVHARGGSSYNLRFGTAFSDGEGFALLAGAAVAAGLLAGIRWAAALLVIFGVLVVALGVVHPCRVAFQDSPQFDRCTVSASASAIGLYLPFSAALCAAAAGLAPRVTRSPIAAASVLAGSAVALLVSLFEPWYGATDDGHDYTQTGWQAFQRFDVLLVVAAALASALAVMALRGGTRAAARLGPAVSLLALSAAGIVFYRLFTSADPPSGGYTPLVAAFVALGALALIAFAALAAARD